MKISANMGRSWLVACTLMLVNGMAGEPARAAPGDLDLSFGNSGTVTTDISTSDKIEELVLQTDGKFVAIGVASNDFALARYNPDGSIDPSFGTAGITTTDFFGSFDSVDGGAIQPDGKIVAVGAVSGATSGIVSFGLARHNIDGSLDTSFGSGGKVVTNFFGFGGTAEAVSVQANGKIVIVGSTSQSSGNRDFALARYNPDGSLDSSFGTAGKVTTDILGGSDSAERIIVTPSGKIIVAGHASNPANTNTDFALARYNIDGSLDMSFGSGGKVTTDFSGVLDHVDGAAAQTDGKIVLVGYTLADFTTANRDFALARYNSDGSLDASFGSGGKVTTDFFGGFDQAQDVSLQRNGKIVVAGEITDPPASGTDFALARYNSDGSLDPSFGINGKVSTDFGSHDDAAAIALQQDGKIVLAGRANLTTSSDFGLARYLGDPVAPLDQLAELAEDVLSLNLPKGIENSLLAKLNAAQNKLNDSNSNNDQAAVNQIEAFINQVEAQQGKKISSEDGDSLIAAAEAIIDALNA